MKKNSKDNLLNDIDDLDLLPDSIEFRYSNQNFHHEQVEETLRILNGMNAVQNAKLTENGKIRVVVSDSTSVIDKYAFKGCELLEEIIIPESVTEIGFFSFINCSSLQTIYCTEEQKQMLIDSELPEQTLIVTKEETQEQDKGHGLKKVREFKTQPKND